MNFKVRDTRASVSLLIALALALTLTLTLATRPSFAQATAKSIKDQLVGHWQLVAVTINDAAPYGANPQGSMFFDANGNYSVVVLSGGKARNISYFGTYTVSDADSTVTLHIDGSNRANADGRNQKRLVRLAAMN